MIFAILVGAPARNPRVAVLPVGAAAVKGGSDFGAAAGEGEVDFPAEVTVGHDFFFGIFLVMLSFKRNVWLLLQLNF